MSNEQTLVKADELHSSKKARRVELAQLPVEKKVEILIKLQQLTSEVARQAGRPYRNPWAIDTAKSFGD
jgi:hypothetical protein